MTDPVTEGASTPEELAAQWEAEKPPPAGPLHNLGAAIAVVALGAATAIGAANLGLGSLSAPGAGLWPFAIGIFLACSGLALALTSRRLLDAERFHTSSLKVLLGLATMIAFATLVSTIGFEIPGALLAFVWLKVLGRESWRLSIVLAVVMVAAFYLVFVLGLGTPIPHLF